MSTIIYTFNNIHIQSVIAMSTIIYTFRVLLLYLQYYIHRKREKVEREGEEKEKGGGGEMERGGKGTEGEKDTGIDRQRL